jgi:hypothetical protein
MFVDNWDANLAKFAQSVSQVFRGDKMARRLVSTGYLLQDLSEEQSVLARLESLTLAEDAPMKLSKLNLLLLLPQ